MANIFAITAAATEIKADPSGKASTTFTVTNTSNRPVRGIAKAKVSGNTQQGWLTVDGETERDFAANGTQQFTVNFNRPPAPNVAAEKFPFRLDVVSAANPDEQFTEGPTVNVEVAPPPAPVKPGFPVWIIIVIAVVAVLVIALVLFLVLRGGGEGNGGNNGNQPPQNTNIKSPTPVPSTPTPEPVTNFAGTWKVETDNVKPIVVQGIEINQRGKTLTVDLSCAFVTCDQWGTGKGIVDGDKATVSWNKDGNTGKAVITLLKANRIHVDGKLNSAKGLINPVIDSFYLKNSALKK